LFFSGTVAPAGLAEYTQYNLLQDNGHTSC